MASLMHVVSKANNAQSVVCRASETLEALPLALSSVRVRTSLIALTSNNLTYARGGKTLHWWDTYPVPESAPAPYNNREDWGIVPAWGYGRVVDSTIDSISPGSLLWGMWPTSAHPVDLCLRPVEPAGHWRECSPHREKLMTSYNSYEQALLQDSTAMSMTALCKPLWNGPYLLSQFSFSEAAIHPFGFGDPWSAGDADLSSAVVISLSASSKTGRSFFWSLAMARDVTKQGPLALLQLTSAPDTLSRYPDSALPTKAARYDEPGVMTWVADFQPSRIVIVDFGVSDDVMEALSSVITTISQAVTIIAVGYEAKVYSSIELEERVARNKRLRKVQLNASGLRDRAGEAIGPQELSRQLREAWTRCCREGGYSNLQVKLLHGVEGTTGIKGAWDNLCEKNVPVNTGMVIKL